MTILKDMKSLRKLICLLISLSLIFSASPGAFAVTQSEIDALRREKETLLGKKAEKQAEIDSLREEESNILELKLALDERNLFTIEQMELVSEELRLCAEMIFQKEKELEQAKELEAAQYERYRSRVRAMEENGEISLLSLILNAGDIPTLLSSIDDIREIMEYDKQLEANYIAARENSELVHREYVRTKSELEGRQTELKAEQAELEKQLGETIVFMEEIKQRIGEESEILEQISAEVSSAQSEIDRLVAELEAQRIQQQRPSTGGSVSSAGDFSWPCPGVTYISSRYGPRYHPVTGLYQSNHSGLDIGAAHGSAISSAGAGTVSCAGVKGGYGNCVMVDHGGGTYTLYAHMSSIAVSLGQYVNSGDTLGYVGDTGITSGPHLHFEIRLNGSTVDPAPYFSGLTYAPDA